MLKELIRGREKSKIVLIEDECEEPGLGLMKSWIVNLAQRYDVLHLLLYETSQKRFMNGLQQYCTNCDVQIYDFSVDPLGWDGGSMTLAVDPVQLVADRASSQTSAVVIDSLSNMIFHRSPSYTCQVLQRLTRINEGNIEQIAAVYHEDLHNTTTTSLLHHTATTILKTGPPAATPYNGSCKILHKKTTGKVSKLREQYLLTSEYEVSETEELHKLSDALVPSSENIDPAANLTFNLTLSDKEKEDRSRVPLPYMHQTEQLTVGPSGSGKIFYQPDDADDFDEEDPDDDLEI